MLKSKPTHTCSCCGGRFTSNSYKVRYCRDCKYKNRKSKTLESRFWEKVDKTDSCWLWTAGKVQGYGMLGVGKRGNQTIKRAHRYSWEIHNGPIPDGLWVLHKCDNPSCVNPDHLFLGTDADNMKDKQHKNRAGMKLTPEQVLEIRRDYAPRKNSYRKLASKYGVSLGLIQKIISRKQWNHL